MRPFWIVLGLSFLLLVLGFSFIDRNAESRPDQLVPTAGMTIHGIPLRIAVADTPASRERGLSGYGEIGVDEGMLFVFETDAAHSFWMKDMLFPIDIMWLDADGKVVHIERNVSPDTYPASFMPDSAARYVLETQAGFSQKYDIQIGSRATFE